MAELPHWRVVMRRERSHAGMLEIASAHGEALDMVRSALRDRGTVTGRDFKREGPAIEHYRGSSPASLALYYLWRTGEAMTHHRERFQRIYARAEAVATAHLLNEAEEEEADLFLARKAVAFAGIGRIGRVGQPASRLFGRPVARDEETALGHRLADMGVLAPVRVEAWRGIRYVLADDLQRLAAIDRGGIPPDWQPLNSGAPSLALLSPLDPVSARGRAKVLFDFDYMWEIYLPAGQVKFGRYAMPILWGDRLVGRIDLKHDRKASAIVANGLWFEERPIEEPGDFAVALGSELRRLAQLVGAAGIDLEALPSSPVVAGIRAALRG